MYKNLHKHADKYRQIHTHALKHTNMLAHSIHIPPHTFFQQQVKSANTTNCCRSSIIHHFLPSYQLACFLKKIKSRS